MYKIYDPLIDLVQRVSADEGAKEAVDNSSTKGKNFNSTMDGILQKMASANGDEIEFVNDVKSATGLKGGDEIVTLPPEMTGGHSVKIVWEFKTPEQPRDSWPFTAIRIPNGNTIVNLTHGNSVVEVDKDGQIVWQCSNADLPEVFKDPCGAQWLPNGNVVITSYAAKGDAIKLFEINREKKIVWSRQDGKPHGIHEFQILDTNGKALEEVFR
jgi:hypothetical protein